MQRYGQEPLALILRRLSIKRGAVLKQKCFVWPSRVLKACSCDFVEQRNTVNIFLSQLPHIASFIHYAMPGAHNDSEEEGREGA